MSNKKVKFIIMIPETTTMMMDKIISIINTDEKYLFALSLFPLLSSKVINLLAIELTATVKILA